ncbi:MAG TPA: penicillin-binding protein 2 [Elusimicrobia bacterium]|nr:penicillin-binding protein 2 [Elusimicrobiota bacterium]
MVYLFYLQVVRGKYFYQVSEGNRREIYLQSRPRGIIYDRDGKILADNRPVSVLFLSLQNLNEETLKQTLEQLEKKFNFSQKELFERINLEKEKLVLRLKEEISREEMLKLEENRINLPGINLQIELKRRYPLNNFAAHLLGYLNEINREELDRLFLEGYRPGDFIGKSGIELTYDNYLRGEPGGMEIEVDARGRQKRIISNFFPSLGKSLILTLDSKLQAVAEEELINKGRRGVIIVLEPQSGEILALVSSPGYNPNLFIEKQPEEVKKLLNDSSLPLFNRAIQGRYAPGSVFKIITAIAALEENKINLNEEFYCSGSFTLGNNTFHCWEEKGHGHISFLPALIHSCDIYFYLLGLRCGAGLIEDYAKKFGLDTVSQIDLLGEKKGFIPGKVWKKKYLKQPWYEGDTVNLSIGQGYVLVTPLALANLAAILANRGKLLQPHIVKKIVEEGEVVQPQIIWEASQKEILHLEISEKTWQIINEGLGKAVDEGTGRAASISGLEIAGKTGTAENPHGEDHAWFVGYAPIENPRIAFAIFVEHGGRGGVSAAPIARRLILTYLKNKNAQITSVSPLSENESN